MAPAQRGLFDEPGATPLVRIEPATPELSKSQRLFNQLTERLQALRAELAAWRLAADRYRQHAAAEIEPLRRELLAEQRAAVLFLDALLASDAKADRLTRRRRTKLRGIVAALAEVVLQAGPDSAIEAIFDRHGGVRHRDLRRAELELAAAMFGQVLGEDIVAGHTAENVDELIEQAGERLHAKLEAEAERRQRRAETRRARRQDTDRVEAARAASQSVREVFRRLAGALHPDREPDAAERERKTALMQRVNQAYERNDLLELLTVQIEIEQIDSAHLAQASEERVGHYCMVLREQQRALQDELAAIQAPFRAALDIEPGDRALRPEVLDVLLDQDARGMREALGNLRSDMEALRDPARRAAAIDDIDGVEADTDDADAIAAMLVAAAREPARHNRPKAKRRRRR